MGKTCARSVVAGCGGGGCDLFLLEIIRQVIIFDFFGLTRHEHHHGRIPGVSSR